MIEIAVASIPFAILMYHILKKREPEEKFARNIENDTQDLPKNDTDDAYGTDNETIEDLSQKERNPEIESGHYKTDKENLTGAPSKRNDMLVLLVYYYQTIVKIIELIMSKRALRKRRSRRDNYESMLPLSRSSKESDLLAPSALYEGNKSDETDEEQDLDDEFEMQHQEASIDNLEVFIAQRRKLETYLQHYDVNDIDNSLSEETENDESVIIIPPPDTFMTDNEITISDIEKALLIESEQVALLIDESSYEDSESVNITDNLLRNSFDETISEIYSEHTQNSKEIMPKEKKQLSPEIMFSFEENKETRNIIEGLVESEYVEQSVPTKESEMSDYDITLKELEYTYDEESEISDTLINETLTDSSKHSYPSDNENFEKINYNLKTDYLCSDGKTIENSNMFEATGIIDEMEKRYMPNKNNEPPIKLQQTDYDENSLQDKSEVSTDLETQFEEITQESNISESNMNIKDNNKVFDSKVIENRIPTTETDFSENTKSIKEPVNINQAESENSEPLIEESQNYHFQSLKTLSSNCLEKSTSQGFISKDTCDTDIIVREIGLIVTDGTIDNNDNRIFLSQEFPNDTKDEIHENSKESETRITTLEDKGKSDSDIQISPIEKNINENLVTEKHSSNEKSLNIDNSEKSSSGVLKVGDNENLDVTSRLDINTSTSDQEFENLYKESINISDENTDEYEDTLLNETFNTDGLSKDIDNVSKTSNKKSFRNKGKRRKCNHKAVKKNKVSENENEAEDEDESLIKDECSQSDLQNTSSEAETREEIQPITSGAAVSLDKGRKYGQVSEYILLKEIEQVESLIREAVAENSDLSDSFVESFFVEGNNNSESAGSFQTESRNLESIKEETVEDTNNISNECGNNEKLCLSDDKNNDETSVTITETDSDNDGGKKQDEYDLEEAYAVCEYEEVTEDVYETFCDESDFMVPVIKRDDEWWTTLSDRDASQFETVGDKNDELNNLECIPKSSETKKKRSVQKKVSFCADNELATIIVDNIDREHLEEYKDSSLLNTDNYLDVIDIYDDDYNINNTNTKSFFTTEVSDLMMELDTYDDIDMFKNDDIDRVLSSYETLGNLVAVDEYDTQAKQTKHVDECCTEVPEECKTEDFQTDTYENTNKYTLFNENGSASQNSYSGKLDIVCCDRKHIEFDTISTLDECKAFEAEDISSDIYSKYISYTADEKDYLEVDFIDHSNIDECAAFEASEECDLMVPRTGASNETEYSLNCVVDESEEILHQPSVQDTFLNESFLVSPNIDKLNHSRIYQAPSIDEKPNEIIPVSIRSLSETSSNMSKTANKIVNSIGNEISYDGSLSNNEDETEKELYTSSLGDRMEVLRTDLEMELENGINNFDEDITQIDKCKAFNATSEPSVIEDAVVSKIKELESQMKAIESCLNSPNNINDQTKSTDQTDMNSTSTTVDEAIQNVSFSDINISGYEYMPVVSREGCSEDMKNEAGYQLSNGFKYKILHTEDIRLFKTQPEEILLDQYAASNFNEEINVNETRENYYKLVNDSLTNIDECTAFKAEEFNNENILIDSEKSTYLPIIEYINNESTLESNIDQCKAFHAESNYVETDSDKTKLLPVEGCYVNSVQKTTEYIPDLCPFVQYSLKQCTDFYADEIRLCTNQLKDEWNENNPASHAQPSKDTDDKNNLLSPFFSYSKIEQCQSFGAGTSEFDNSLLPPIIPSVNTSINLPALPLSKEETDQTLTNLDQCQAFNADTSESGNSLVPPIKPSINPPISLPVLTLSKEESDYTLTVRLEKFKRVEVLQAASISQDESSYKVSYE